MHGRLLARPCVVRGCALPVRSDAGPVAYCRCVCLRVLLLAHIAGTGTLPLLRLGTVNPGAVCAVDCWHDSAWFAVAHYQC